MHIIEPSFEILNSPKYEDIINHLEIASRTCYKSEDKIECGSAEKLLTRILKMGHESVLEHSSISVRITCDRGVTHELVRHRICSFSQESTRYANYSKNKFGNEITVIRPFFWLEDDFKYKLWQEAVANAEQSYLQLIENGATAQEARSVLPNSLKSDIIMTCNIREWRHIFKLRCDTASHPQMRQIMLPLLEAFYQHFSLLFADLYNLFFKKNN